MHPKQGVCYGPPASFNEFGSYKLATVDPATVKLEEYNMPNDRSRGRRTAITSDDRVWYVDYTRGSLGRLPGERRVQGRSLPGGVSAVPYAMASDDEDRL